MIGIFMHGKAGKRNLTQSYSYGGGMVVGSGATYALVILCIQDGHWPIDIYSIPAISRRKVSFLRLNLQSRIKRNSLKGQTIELLERLKPRFRQGIFMEENLHARDWSKPVRTVQHLDWSRIPGPIVRPSRTLTQDNQNPYFRQQSVLEIA